MYLPYQVTYMVALNDNTTFSAVLNCLSEAKLIAHTHKYFCAAFPRLRQLNGCAYYHSNGSSSKSNLLADK